MILNNYGVQKKIMFKPNNLFFIFFSMQVLFGFIYLFTWLHRYYLNWAELENGITESMMNWL